MKKRITSVLLALLMALTLLPATAWAEDAEVPCYWFRDTVGYTSVGLPPELPGVTWDQENEVLTLNNAHLTKSVYVPSDATVVLIGDNTITVASTADYHCGLDGYGCRRHEAATTKALKIKGPGTLTIQTSDVAYEYCFGLYATNHLALSDGCTVKIAAGGASEAKYDSFYRKDMSYSYGIRTNKIDVDASCTLEVASGTAVRSWAIYCTDATLNGEVTVTSGTADESSGIYAVGKVTVNAPAYVKAYGAIDNFDKEDYNKPDMVIVAENATVKGAKEEFVSGTTKHLTPASSGQPIEIYFDGSGESEDESSYSVTIIPDATMTPDSDSASRLTQKVNKGDYMKGLFFVPAEGYYFPAGYSASDSGIQVERMHSGEIRVYGIPTDNVTLRLPAASESLRGTVTIDGTAKVGQMLTAVTQLENLSAADNVLYQWCYDNGATLKAISGATDSTYTPTEADLDKMIFVMVGDSARPDSYVFSGDVGPVAAADDPDPTPDPNPNPNPNPKPTPKPGHTTSGGSTVTGSTVTSAKTFDAGVAAYGVTALLSLSGMAWLGRKRED